MNPLKENNHPVWLWKDAFNIINEKNSSPETPFSLIDELNKFAELTKNNNFDVYAEDLECSVEGNVQELYLIIKSSVLNSAAMILENSPYPMLSVKETEIIAKILTARLITSETSLLARLSLEKDNAVKDFVLLIIEVIINLQKKSGHKPINYKNMKIKL